MKRDGHGKSQQGLHHWPDESSLILFLISLDRVGFDWIKLKVSPEKIDRSDPLVVKDYLKGLFVVDPLPILWVSNN